MAITSAEAAYYSAASREWYVTELTFLGGDLMFEEWINQESVRRRFVRPDERDNKPNLFVHYVRESDTTPTTFTFAMQTDSEARAFLDSINSISRTYLPPGGRGRRANFEMQRKTWKEHQGKADPRRLQAIASEVVNPATKHDIPDTSGPQRSPVAMRKQIGAPEIPFDLTTPEGRQAYRESRGL